MFWFMSMCCDTAQTKAKLKAVKGLLFSSKTTLIFMLQNTFKHTSELERLGVLVHVHVLGHSPSQGGAQGRERSSFSVLNPPWSFLPQGTSKHNSEQERLGVLVHVHVLGHSPNQGGAQGSERSSFSVPNPPWSFLLRAPLCENISELERLGVVACVGVL